MRRDNKLLIALALFGIGLTVFLSSRLIPTTQKWNFETEACRRAYEDLYSQPSIDARVIFGYKDARPARFVADRYEKLVFIEKLTRGCGQDEYACGFQRSEKDADLFMKNILGPDGRKREVFLRVVQASAGPDDEENRRNPFQKWKTQAAESAFYQGLANADLVFYNGHSRAGGGPDFGPPVLDASETVDFRWYKENTPGFSRMKEFLKREPHHLKMFGLYSCASSRHFVDDIHEVRPGLGIMGSSRLIYFSDALESSREALSALLGMKCESAFVALTKKPEMRAGGTHISGFFSKSKK